MEKRYESERRGLAEAAALRKQGRAQEADSVLLATTYHRDHGTGLDCYKVGPSLGCGTPAVLLGDSLVLPWCFERYEVKENGPLRFTVELTYPAKRIGKETLREHRLISLSKGDYFNRITVWYEGMKKSQIDVCGGLVVHTKRTADLTLADDFIAYTDPTDNAARHNFEIYVAVVFPDGINETRLIRDPHHRKQGIIGNAIGVKTRPHSRRRLHLLVWCLVAQERNGRPGRMAGANQAICQQPTAATSAEHQQEGMKLYAIEKGVF